MTQALVNAEQKELTTWTPPEGGWASDGTEDIPPAFPIVSIVQPMTKGKNMIAGFFYHSDDEQCTSDFDGVLLVKRETRALFVDGDEKPACRSEDGKMPAPRQKLWISEDKSGFKVDRQPLRVPPVQPQDCANCPFSAWGGPNQDEPPICGNSYVLIAARNGEPEDLVQLRIKGTSIKPFRQWVARKLAPKRLPMFFFSVHLTTEEKEGAVGKWHQLVIESFPLSEPEAYTYNEVINAHRARIEHAVREAGGEVQDWEEPEDMPFE